LSAFVLAKVAKAQLREALWTSYDRACCSGAERILMLEIVRSALERRYQRDFGCFSAGLGTLGSKTSWAARAFLLHWLVGVPTIQAAEALQLGTGRRIRN